MEMTNFPAFLYATASEIPAHSYTWGPFGGSLPG